ncbi:MAG TPA: response regulator transcription factor [Bacteroidales bacterium]|nr:response regulator transcription factor [Bacteroidales bacterium]
MKINIILADDHNILREGLRNVIESFSTLKVIGEANDGREAVSLANRLHPDVVIMDVSMPGLNGVEATRQIVRSHPDIRVIALSMHANKQMIAGILKAGAYGYLLKDCASGELINAIKTVAANKKYISNRVSELFQDNIMAEKQGSLPELSVREKEILQLIAEGHSSKEIADMLFLSSKTVDAHRKNIMDKLDLHSIPELTKYALKSGLTSLDN